jgi:hypothetical protein
MDATENAMPAAGVPIEHAHGVGNMDDVEVAPAVVVPPVRPADGVVEEEEHVEAAGVGGRRKTRKRRSNKRRSSRSRRRSRRHRRSSRRRRTSRKSRRHTR